MRVFRKLNVVRQTDDPLKAARYLADGYEEITKKSKQKGNGEKNHDKAAEAETAVEPDGK